ncbi:ATP-dependent DNA ligase [Flavobacterium sp. HSC-61S13]|uniref:ATP-dependent DNA ligase n=1 Tax=Flavobacterium sp. HSC-61S13 TaxID=2910963 RepID=UPI0020A0E02D|nr:ATP-dependent DNA ligase [Flavobacterium sp. HSC-61S13]MCP1996465.1 DNA ligase-1 [Flavobacterium sp. HSC-61S13]
MKTFATLIHALDSTNKTTHKYEAIYRFLDTAEERDKLWFLALFTGRRPKRSVNTTLLKQWAITLTELPEWLFVESYATVGDLGETIALILPPSEQTTEQSLSQWMDQIIALRDGTEEEKREFVIDAWMHLNLTERFIFNKLIGGSFRIGVSSKTLINAFAHYYQLEPAAVTHSLMGDWQMDQVNFEDLVHGKFTEVHKSKPYPFCLAYGLDKEIEELGEAAQWQVEYKWDGIRAQIIKRDGEVFIWSRGEELITAQFPEIEQEFLKWTDDFVVDGELLVVIDKQIQNFTSLQKRLNRKTLTKKMLQELPVSVYLYDMLEYQGTDIREQPLRKRRVILEDIVIQNPSTVVVISQREEASNWQQVIKSRSLSREHSSEGLMIKNLESPYHSGRKRGDWWKWKLEPLTIDAVLIYAQKGSGRRSGHYTDYTFAIRNGDALVTIAKAYSGLTDKEIQEVSKFVNKNAIEKFGPVRTVKPELVFEIAFEGIGFSSRHKSGVALRFPRIKRWRRDKTVADIDTLEQVKSLIS